MPAFDDTDFGVLQLLKSKDLSRVKSAASNGHSSGASYGSSLSIPGDNGNTPSIGVPATRLSLADAAPYMHRLSFSPSQKERRGSRNSFGASLPFPRSKRQSRLSSVVNANGKLARPGMPSIQPIWEILASQMQDLSGEKAHAAEDMAFVFDIDGVLVHGDRLIPEGQRALEILNGDNELGIKIPHIFLTYGSGKPEQARIEQLSRILQQPISIEQFIQSHTPMRALSEYYDTVLVVGGEGYCCREVAEQYGFKDIVIPNDIIAWDTTITTYRVFTEEERKTSRPREFSKANIEALMVFSILSGLRNRHADHHGFATSKYADEVIAGWMKTIHNDEKLPSSIYMVGDNPASDIVGGNSYGWNTCLVRIGVFQGGDNDEENPANFGVFKNVLEAVKTAVRKELGQDFNFEWKDERVNPLLQNGNLSAAVAVE